MELTNLLEKALIKGASDIHIGVGAPPVLRIHGELGYLDEPNLTPETCLELAKQCLTEDQFRIFEHKGQADSAYSYQGLARFRINVFKQRGSIAIALRPIPISIPKPEDLGLPDVIFDMAKKQRGLILITGPTGHGKSTTLATIIDYINSTRRCHVVTIEDPIEFLFKHKKSIIHQREVGADTNSFPDAMRAVLREDPDVIMIGEMRDQETISTALTAAETGHLVLSTLHTLGAAKTIDRVIDVFPPYQQSQVRTQLSTVLQGIVSQQLIRKDSGQGRALATEVMVMTPAISNLIRESRTPQINSCIHTGSQFAMHSMDSSIAELYKAQKIDFLTACQYAIDVDNFKKLI
jgi:twitching motility protein PilT